jgi:two-component system NtrC family sensor kinase
MRPPRHPASPSADAGNDNEVQALAEAVLEAASVAGLGVSVSFDDGVTPRHIYVNDAAAQVLGLSIEELTGSAILLNFAPEERNRLNELTARLRQGDVSPSLTETVVLRPSGERIPVEIAFSGVRLSGEPAIVSFLRDIRERKSADEALRRSEQRFRQLIEAAPDAIGVHRDRRLTYVNPAFAALCGRPFEQLVQRDIGELVHADDRDLLAQHSDADGSAQPGPLEYRILHADGRVVNVETLSIPIEYEGHSAVLGFTRDTTERKLLQAHLALRDRMAMLGMLAASVAHEINNPLAYAALNVEAIIRQLAVAAPEGLPPAIEPAIAAARDGLARVASIVRDLKGLSTPQSAKRWPVDVRDVLESALNVAMHAIRGNARVEKRYDDVPPLETDPTKLGQILLNLVFNAAQSFDLERAFDPECAFDAEGPLDAAKTANVILLAVSSPCPSEVVVTVSDNGPGISRQQLEHIFEPFFTTRATGTGLGLAICQTLANALNAKLGVESELGRGTTFTLRLPA